MRLYLYPGTGKEPLPISLYTYLNQNDYRIIVVRLRQMWLEPKYLPVDLCRTASKPVVLVHQQIHGANRPLVLVCFICIG